MQHTDVLTARIGSVTAPRTRVQRRRAFLNNAARWVVGAGGMATIVSIVAILGFIFIEVLPLWYAPTAASKSSFDLRPPAAGGAVASDEHLHLMAVAQAGGTVDFLRLTDGTVAASLAIPDVQGERIAQTVRSQPSTLLVLTESGRLVASKLRYEYPGNDVFQVPQPVIGAGAAWTVGADGKAPRLLAASVPSTGGVTVVHAGAAAPPQLFAVIEKRSLFGVERPEIRRDLPLRFGGEATAIVVDSQGQYGYVGSSNGYVQRWDLRDKSAPKVSDAADATARRDVAITAMELLIGDQSLIVGDAAGNVSRWFTVRDPEMESGWRLQLVDRLQPHAAAVTAIAASQRDKGFITADAAGGVLLRHATTQRTLLELPGATGGITALAFAPKANGALALDTGGRLVNWSIRNPHPEINLGTLFGKVWYEGYDEPAYVWQSTGGNDTFEPKFSLVPLIVGTMKGTLYALLFAVPIAVLGALYTSQFAHPRLRGAIKPTVEIMAALPSVVLGFLAGLWLAPAIEKVVPGVMAMVVVVPLAVVAAGVVWGTLPSSIRRRVRPGMELLLLVPLVLVAAQVCLWASAPLEGWLFGGDFRTWLYEAGGRFDQRNCIVVGFAMGFAVIPIIFTISEDAISNVPARLISGSLALGATPWQTALRVVLPTASAGIFSAIMVGFGRAVGETMIVLMATGNTPVLDWSIFVGMRTLSANVAVEIPEAPFGGTLYRVLFLAALLLFAVTFVVNTAAEVVRQRLRRKYQNL
jgi:phosphate transport system permease protein